MNNRNELQLIFFAAASLYLELAIIRMTSAEVIYLGYFSNFILISAFVGLGLGFLSFKRGLEIYKTIPFLMLFLFAFVLISEFDVDILRNHFGLFFFGNIKERAGLPGVMLLVTLFLSTVVLFTGIGNRIAAAFVLFKPLKAYSLDIGGSLIGILLFSLQSYISSGPITWVITGHLLLLLGYLNSNWSHYKNQVAGVLMSGVCILLLIQSGDPGTHQTWSTYQKLEVFDNPRHENKVLFANGIIHQMINPVERVKEQYYSLPYTLKKRLNNKIDDVLIIGSGTGTDVAIGLHHGAANIDAVEIDGRIVDLGKQYHPDKPYFDPRVNIIVTDGRQHLKNSDKKYDLIIFALPDSLMRMSAMSSVRLESYLFTKESFQDVKNRLKDDGFFIMYNQYRWDWLVNKLAFSLQSVFDVPPLVIRYPDSSTTLIGVGPAPLQGKEKIKEEGFERIATDDWPFVYMQKPGIHWLYIGMIVMFLVFSLGGVAILAPAGTLRKPEFTFFFMGTAFLLLETKSIALFSLLFGTTWLVNSLTFAGILTSVLIANLVVHRFGFKKRKPLYALLFTSLIVAYFIPASLFLEIDIDAIRYLVAICLVFAPIFFANLVFGREFRDADESSRAFGWNLMGAVLGGGLEYFSLLTGFNNLLLIVMFCYLLAVYFSPREST